MANWQKFNFPKNDNVSKPLGNLTPQKRMDSDLTKLIMDPKHMPKDSKSSIGPGPKIPDSRLD